MHTVRLVVYKLRRIPPSLYSSDEVSPRRNVPTTKRQATKCTRDEAAGEEVYPRRNGWRRSVPATKWLATKCTRDETAATKRPAPVGNASWQVVYNVLYTFVNRVTIYYYCLNNIASHSFRSSAKSFQSTLVLYYYHYYYY